MRELLRTSVPLLIAFMVLSAPRAVAHEGWGIVVAPAGQVYFSDIPANTIWRISQGKVEKAAAGKHSHALVLNAAGDLYGTHPHLTLPIYSVWRLSPEGQLSDVIPPTRNFPLGLQSFLMDGKGNIYSANARNAQTPELLLLRRSPEGRITTLAGSTVGHEDGVGSEARFLNIDGMAWGPDGALYVADGPYVRRVSLDGSVTRLSAGPLTEVKWGEDLLGLALDANGNVYVADYSNRRIRKLTPAGEVSTLTSTGVLWAPTGIAVATDGLYTLEHLRMPLAILGDLGVGPYVRVRKISSDGTVTELARIWGRRSGLVGSVATVMVALVVAIVRFRRKARSPRV
ncbi:MAG TPA: SMP-30/gluconolactonase/LRE family protein [Thermoanaerobaculia bacterium]